MSNDPTHRFVGAHLTDLADGSMVEPGATVTLDRAAVEDPHNARLIADGELLELGQPKKADKPTERSSS